MLRRSMLDFNVAGRMFGDWTELSVPFGDVLPRAFAADIDSASLPARDR